ncbi:Putative DNA-binding helix-turn-helix protein [Mycobacteroides abscessus subsp. massiliense]|nr:Putative DNA-binding helix-turn-helix protein [Mycobacteroides abscessus subsp. massiliense]
MEARPRLGPREPHRMRIGRIVARADIGPVRALPEIDPTDYADEHGEITAAQVLRRLWRIAGPVRSMIELLEAAGVFVVVENFHDDGMVRWTAAAVRCDRARRLDPCGPRRRRRLRLRRVGVHLHGRSQRNS